MPDELLKHGFTSLEALKLVELDDLGSEKIVRGQRRLIMHIVQTILQEGTAANDTPTALSVGTADGITTSVNNTTSSSPIPVTKVQEVEQIVMENTNNNTDMYTSLLANMQSQQKTIQDSMNTNASPQPAWNDPLVHISTASGKSVSQYLDICDIVQSTVIHEICNC